MTLSLLAAAESTDSKSVVITLIVATGSIVVAWIGKWTGVWGRKPAGDPPKSPTPDVTLAPVAADTLEDRLVADLMRQRDRALVERDEMEVERDAARRQAASLQRRDAAWKLQVAELMTRINELEAG